LLRQWRSQTVEQRLHGLDRPPPPPAPRPPPPPPRPPGH
jgi:hypothetical protein